MKSIDSTTPARRGRWIWIVAAVFALLHWDFWLWDDHTLWFGFLPAGLGYHALYSLGAGALWATVIAIAWPSHIEAWASARDDEQGPTAGHAPAAPR